MRRSELALAGLVASVFAAAPAPAQSRLVDEYVRGWQRICIYEMLLPIAGPRERERRQALEIGRGEPCPARYTRPEPQRRPAPARRPGTFGRPSLEPPRL